MVYLSTWEEFSRAAEQLYSEQPSKFRLVVKYRHCDEEMIVKATDDKMCIKYRTNQLQDVKKLEKLNSTLIRLMTH